MLKIKKYFILFVVVLMACMSVAVAADAGDSTEPVTTPAVTSTADNVDVQTVAQADNEITKKLDNNIDEEINYEENTRGTTHNLDDNNFDEYITDSGLSSTVNEGDILNFTSDVTRTTSSYIINKPINIIGNGFTLDLKLTIGEYSNVTNNTFKNSVTIGRYANINDNTFTTPITINEYSNVTNNIFKSDVTLKNNINFKNNNAENSIVNVNGANCYLCNNTINKLIVNDAAYNTYICSDNQINEIEGNEDNVVYVDHPSLLNFNKKLSRTIKTEGEPTYVDITEENFLNYFKINSSGKASAIKNSFTEETILNVYSIPSNVTTIEFPSLNKVQYPVSIVGKNDLTLRNIRFNLLNENMLLTNLTLIYDEDYADNYNNPRIMLGHTSPDGITNSVVLDNVTINATFSYENSGKNLIGAKHISNDSRSNIVIKNSKIDVNAPSTSESCLLIAIKTYNVVFMNNTININEIYGSGDNPSLIGFSATGSVENILFEINNITMTGTEEGGNLYAFKMDTNGTQIKNNNITITSDTTAIAVELTGNDNTVTDNYIVANDKAGNDAVTVTGENNVVENNIGTVDTRIATGIELTYDTNPIDVGDRLIIRGVFKANNVESESSDIKVYDNDELIATTNSDEFGTITYAYTPTASGSHNLTFVFEGNDTHKDASSSITVEVNEVIEPEKEYSLKVDTTEFIQGETTTIKASIYYGNENEEEIATNITKGKVTFKVNGKTLKDPETGKVIYAKVVNGTATIENYLVPDTWDENTMIQAVYSGSSDVEKMTSEKTNITITPKQLTLLTEDTTATTGSTVTLTATLSDNTINNGKIVFKINGKTVKDTNGKVIYAKVANGTVSVEYTLPANMKAGSYTITAVYVSSDYPKLEDNKTLTIN